MPLRTRTLDEHGMTLIEVMVAMVVLLVGVVGTLVLVEGGCPARAARPRASRATNLARDLVERSRQAGYKDITIRRAPTTLRVDAPGVRQRRRGPTGSHVPRSRAATSTTPSRSSPARSTTRATGPGRATRRSARRPTSTNVPGSPTPGSRPRSTCSASASPRRDPAADTSATPSARRHDPQPADGRREPRRPLSACPGRRRQHRAVRQPPRRPAPRPRRRHLDPRRPGQRQPDHPAHQPPPELMPTSADTVTARTGSRSSSCSSR